MDHVIRGQVRPRALERCEYCQVPQSAYALTFQIDHVIARQHGGQNGLENFALSCARCNRFKGPNIAGIDSRSGLATRLYNPRLDRWNDHFRWDRASIIGRTDIGRVTVNVLVFNSPSRVAARAILIEEGKIAP